MNAPRDDQGDAPPSHEVRDILAILVRSVIYAALVTGDQTKQQRRLCRTRRKRLSPPGIDPS
jgi:hypothetical protein